MFRLLNIRVAAATAAGLALGVGAGLALADAAGRPAPGKRAALERVASVATTDSNTEPTRAPALEPHPIPARLLEPDAPVPIPPSVLQPQNGWIVSDGSTLVAVYAGAAGEDPSIGRVVIVRQDLAAGKQTVTAKDAGPTGALTIVDAPLGRSVETSAQMGNLRLRTAGGQVLMLDIGSGEVSHAAYGPAVP